MTQYARFYQNNRGAADATTLTVSSAVSGFPGSDSVEPERWKRWRPSGAFKVVSTNKKIYISDGSNKTITLTEATYATGTLLAAHIQTQLNASSTNWTCTYSLTTYKFTIGRSTTTRSLRLTQTTDAAWSMLGYTGVADFDPSTGTAANVRRNHTSETWTVDLGAALDVSGFMAIGTAGVDFPLSSSATVTLKASNTNNFTSPDATYTLAVTRWGIFETFDTVAYRYWQYEFIDLTNTDGPNLEHAIVYLGDHVGTTTRDLNIGFQRQLVDPSVRVEAESGALYHRAKTKYWTYKGLGVDHILDDPDAAVTNERTEIERIAEELGRTNPFFIVLDPDGVIASDVAEFSKYVVFDDDPVMQHIRWKYWGLSFNLREVV